MDIATATPVRPARPAAAPPIVVIARLLVTLQIAVGSVLSSYGALFAFIAVAWTATDDDPGMPVVVGGVVLVIVAMVVTTILLVVGLVSLNRRRTGRATLLVATETVLAVALAAVLSATGIDPELGLAATGPVFVLVAAVLVPLLVTAPAARNWLAARG